MRTKLNYSKTLKLASVFKSLYHCKTALLAACMIFSISTVVANAQSSIAVHGNVTDASKAPIAGATVVIKGTTTGIITDADGKYSMEEVPKDAVLVFSFMGMISQEIPVSGQKVINVVLKDADIRLDEVVAIGYGTQTKKQVSGSIASVSSGDFNKGVVSSAADLLKGKVAGLAITQPGGDVSQQSSIRLRGASSLAASNDPLVVIDGVPGLSIDAIAPEDIETISVLKDASASAIYGSRGANGVIMITSKKGMASRTQVEYNAYVAVDQTAHMPAMLDGAEYRDYMKKLKVSNFDDNGGNTDWYKAISRTAISQEHNLSLSGGSGNHNYIATINYQNREGVIIGNNSSRLNARFSFTQRAINDRLKMTFTGMTTMRTWSPAVDRALMDAKGAKPTDPIYDKDGGYFFGMSTQDDNPVAEVNLNKNDHTSNFSLVNGNITFNILPSLKYNINLSREMENENIGTYTNSTTIQGRGQGGIAKREALSSNRNILETNLTYDKSWKIHHLTAMAGYSYEEKVWDDFWAQNRDFIVDDFTYNSLNSGSNLRPGDVSSSKSMYKLIGFYARAQYDLYKKYFLTATIRRDGSSKFGANNKWGYFPSASFAWRLSDENFMKSATWVNELKLRAGYGSSGNQGIDPYQSLALYGSKGTFISNGNIITGYAPSQNPNPNLRWETTTQLNVGVDYSFFKDRVYGSIEYYNKKTKDLLYNYPVPTPPYLYSSIQANVGTISNKGIEALINVDIYRTKKFTWTSSFNISSNKNEVVSLSNDQFSFDYALAGTYARGLSGSTNILLPGYPVGEFFGPIATVAKDGTWQYKDLNGIPGYQSGYGNDDTTLGSPFPKFTWGWSNTFKYKNIDASFFIRGSEGNKVLNLARTYYENPNTALNGNVYKSVLNTNLTDNPVISSYYIEDGSFARLENLTVGYTLNTSKISWISKMRFYFTGQNLFIITGYSGTDPEVSLGAASYSMASGSDRLDQGLRLGTESQNFYPKTRTYTFGFNVTF